MQSSRKFWMLPLSACLACTGTIDAPSMRAPSDAIDNPVPDDPPGVLPVDSPCAKAGFTPAPTPLARLTEREYRNTVAALFPTSSNATVSLASDGNSKGFDNTTFLQSPSASTLELYQGSAEAIATAVSKNPGTLLPCPIAQMGTDPSCGDRLVAELLASAFRRPPTEDELTRYRSAFHETRIAFDGSAAVRVLIEAVLQSPNFLYRPEPGVPVENSTEIVRLTGYELASRLSYLLWDSMPDATLIEAAASGELNTPSGIATQVERMMNDKRGKSAVAHFNAQWTGIANVKDLVRRFPDFNAELAAAMQTSAQQFLDHAFWEGSVETLFTDNRVSVNAALAKTYGIVDNSATFHPVELDPSQRSGLLTQAALLTRLAHEDEHAPVLRGMFVMDRLLCTQPPPPPGDVVPSIEAYDATKPMTLRQRLEETHEKGGCASCHATIDNFGYAMENFDATGRWRESENGLPVDARVTISGFDDLDGSFDGAVALSRQLAKSPQVRDCLAKQWVGYTVGVEAANIDACTIEPIVSKWLAVSDDPRQLLHAIATSDAFRFRDRPTLENNGGQQ